MSEFEDNLNSILGDPDKMQSIASMARSLMGEGSGAAPDTDPGLPGRIGELLSGGVDDRRSKLLEAMRPFLSERRKSKMDRALRIARLASIAELTANGSGGDGDV